MASPQRSTTAVTLPSISSLLNAAPPSPCLSTPAFSVSPPSPVSSRSSSPPTLLIDGKLPRSPSEHTRHLSLSPLLSPADSCVSPFLLPSKSPCLQPAPSEDVFLPPLQGNDPPRTQERHLELPSIFVYHIAPWSEARDFATHHAEKKRRTSQQSLSLSPSFSSPSTFSSHTPPSPSVSTVVSIPPSGSHRTSSPSGTQIILSSSGQTILKRRRGRPPSTREPNLDGGWTFLTPTVWDVKAQNEPQSEPPNKAAGNYDGTMNGSMAAFTSANMDTVLHMPNKKRGRKPKTHIAGNSCFVWRELSCTRSLKKQTKDTPSTESPTQPTSAN